MEATNRSRSTRFDAFDVDMRSRTVRFHIDDLDFPTAMRILGEETGTFWRPLTKHLFLVAENTTQKRKDYALSVVRTVTLPASETPEQMTEIFRLVREIAEVYGQRPGLAGTVHLLRRLASGAGMVGAVDLVGGILVQQLGGAVMERLSASAAESAYAAQKMARLGIIAMALCRPIDFRPGEVPSLRSLVSGLFKPSADKAG